MVQRYTAQGVSQGQTANGASFSPFTQISVRLETGTVRWRCLFPFRERSLPWPPLVTKPLVMIDVIYSLD